MPTNEMYGYGLFERTPEQIDKELLYSSHGILKKGGILAAGHSLATGTVLSYDEPTGKWIPYDDVADVNEVQTVTNAATSGQYRLTFRGAQTGDLAWNAPVATVDAALGALSTVGGAGNVTVAGDPDDYTITFVADLAAQDVDMVTVQPGTTPFAGGTITVAETTKGVRGGQAAQAILGHACDASDRDEAINVYFAGFFKTAALVGMDANALTDLGARVNAAYGYTHVPG